MGVQDVWIFFKLHGKETRVEQRSHWASVTPYCLAGHLCAGVITTGPWEECFTPWTARLPSTLACDLLGTITCCCFLARPEMRWLWFQCSLFCAWLAAPAPEHLLNVPEDGQWAACWSLCLLSPPGKTGLARSSGALSRPLHGSPLYFMKVMSLLHSLLTTRQFLEDVLMVLMYKRRLAFGTLSNRAVDFFGLWLLSYPSLPACNVVLINGNWFYFFSP